MGYGGIVVIMMLMVVFDLDEDIGRGWRFGEWAEEGAVADSLDGGFQGLIEIGFRFEKEIMEDVGSLMDEHAVDALDLHVWIIITVLDYAMKKGDEPGEEIFYPVGRTILKDIGRNGGNFFTESGIVAGLIELEKAVMTKETQGIGGVVPTGPFKQVTGERAAATIDAVQTVVVVVGIVFGMEETKVHAIRFGE
jgi:hypothetical protein